MFSFHGGHSGEFCSHASGTLRDVINTAVKAGFTHLGISEHLPSLEGFLYPDEVEHGAVFLEQRFSRLMNEVRAELHAEFDSQLQLFIGFETEFYGPDPLQHVQEAIERYSPEIIVASVHHVRGVPIDMSPEVYQQAIDACGGMEELWCEYFESQAALFRFLAPYAYRLPVVAGHLDVIKLLAPQFAPTAAVWERIRASINAACRSGLVFEVNSRALKKGLAEPYPGRAILEEIQRQGGCVTFGDDSHGPADVGLLLEEARMQASSAFSTATVFERAASGYQRKELPII